MPGVPEQNPPGWGRCRGERAARGAMLADYEAGFDAGLSALPDRPDEAAVESWLHDLRRAHWDAADGRPDGR